MISRGAVAPRSPSPGAAPGKPPGAPLTAYAIQRAFNEDDRHIGATKKILRRAGRIRTDDYSLFLDYIADKNFAFCEGGRQVSGPPPRYNGEVSGGYIPCDITKSVAHGKRIQLIRSRGRHSAADKFHRSVDTMFNSTIRLALCGRVQNTALCAWIRRGATSRAEGYCLGIRPLKRQEYCDEPQHNCMPRIAVTM
jgi:hypothetical protein